MSRTPFVSEPGSMPVLRSRAAFLAWRDSLAAARTVGFVPTMGALHQGHAELLRHCRKGSDVSVLSIFVNPTQFGPSEDLARYPRSLESDLALARDCGVDAVYAPEPHDVYPPDFSTWVEEGTVSQPLCGRFRPGHFRGVTTIVLKLLNLVRPETAYFGLKDAQQFFVLSRMARDLDLSVLLVGVPTVRETDGLALSSRNVYLSASDRQAAPTMQRALGDAARACDSAAGDSSLVSKALATARGALTSAGFALQYLELLELPMLAPTDIVHGDRPYVLAAAAKLGATRLIDNVILHPERLAAFGITLAQPHGV